MAKKPPPASPLDQAEGLLMRPGVHPAALIDAIHLVNPTGLDLGERESTRRYALKSRLQSKLLREHLDEMELEASPTEEGVVGLRHRPLGKDACHVPVRDLDEDVRSLVQLRLDTAEEVTVDIASPGVPRRSARATATLLEAGHQALAEYDFEAARSAFEGALADDHGDSAASALLELLVDHLASWDEAVAVEAVLDEAQRTSRVRSLLAAAHAELGHGEECERLLAANTDARSVTVRAVLVRRALATGALDEAARHLGLMSALDGSHPERVALEGELEQRRAEARRPAEEALERLRASGSGDLEAAARALLERWPESVSARRLLKEREAARRASAAAELTAQGEGAFARGEDALALELWAEAIACGAEGLETRMSTASERQRARQDRARIDSASSGLTKDLGAASLAQYLELPASLRAEVRRALDLAVLDWLEQLHRDSPKAEQALDVEAVLALDAVTRSADPSGRERLLALHGVRLARISAGRQLLEAVDRQRRQATHDANDACLADARAALAAGRWIDAQTAASGLLTQGPPWAEAAEPVMGIAQGHLAREDRVRGMEEALAKDDLGLALKLIRQAELDPLEDHPRWAAHRAAVATRVERAWRVERLEDAAGIPAPDFSEHDGRDSALISVDLDGRFQYLVRSYSGELFIWKADLATGLATSMVGLRCPRPLEFPKVLVDGNAVRIVGPHEALSLTTSLEVREWFEVPEVSGEVFEDHHLVPGGRYYWQVVRHVETRREVIRITDVDRGRLHREMPHDGAFLELLTAPTGVQIYADGYRRPGRRHAPGGGVLGSLPEDVNRVAVGPDGRGYLGATFSAEEPTKVFFVDDGKAPTCVEQLDGGPETPSALATSLAAQRSYLLEFDAEPRLRCYEAPGDGQVRCGWTVGVPDGCLLTQDVQGHRVFLLLPDERQPRAIMLGREPPELGAFAPLEPLPLGHPLYWCRRHAQEEIPELDHVANEEGGRDVAQVLEEHAGRPEVLAELLVKLREREHESEEWLTEIGRRALDRFPENAALLIVEAQAALAIDPLRALGYLARVGRTKEVDAHLEHLTFLALYRAGRLDEALLQIERIPEDSDCDVSGWRSWLLALQGRGTNGSRAVQVLDVVRTATRRRDEGRIDEALEALDSGVVWGALDLELAALLADLAMRPSAVPRLRRRRLVAKFLDEASLFESGFARGILWPESVIGQIDLAALGVRARKWLDERGD